MPVFVGQVCGMRIPPQVVYPIIGWITVIVASLHAIRARTYECLKNETVNIPAKLLLAFV
jgi:hypothetical protein